MSRNSRSSYWLEAFPNLVHSESRLARLTTLRVGGPSVVLAPTSIDQLREVVSAASERREPYRVMGSGANLLVGDEGVSGPVINLRQFRYSAIEGERFRASAGVPLAAVVTRAAHAGLAGLEPLIGIPATVGGAVAMNAGGRYGSTCDHLVSVLILRADGGIESRPASALHASYRQTELGPGEIVIEATFKLQPDRPEAVIGRTQDVFREKSTRQPLEAASAGCIFKNPDTGDSSAGRLIEEAGLKGLSIGEAAVSEKHANFIVNKGRATASDVMDLIAVIQERVLHRFGVELELEVKTWSDKDESVLQPA